MDYAVEDMVVVPGCGVGRGEAVELYRIDLGDTKGRMWVPTHLVNAQGLRPVMTIERAKEAWTVIEAQAAPDERQNWNRRQRRYNEKLLSNEPIEMAELLGELAAVRNKKELSFGERKIFEKVRELLICEIAAAMAQPRPKIEQRMSKALAA